MFVNERSASKCRESPRKDGDGSDLSLSGSQVSLLSRPRSVTGKASIRALSVSGPRPRRPMSAMPTLCYTDVAKKKRPYSADSQPLVALSHQRLNKTSTCFSLTSDFMDNVLHGPSQDLDIDGDLEFSTSTILSSQMSDQLGNAWMEVETIGSFTNNVEPFYRSYSTDNSSDLFCYSDISEEANRSEKSLGEHIRAMAQFHLHNNSNTSTQSSLKSKSHSTSATATSSDKEECPSRDSHSKIKDEDPKSMTTRELHFRMVESGLYLHSQQKSPQVLKECNSDNFQENMSSGSQFLNDENKCAESTAHFHAKDCTQDEQLSSSFPNRRADTATVPCWPRQNDLSLFPDTAVCNLEEVSFPEEHEVDSLDGDSHNSKHDLASNVAIHDLPENNSKAADGRWMKQSVIPVHFQQWVSASNSENVNQVDEGSCAFYFCSAQTARTHPKKTIPDTDCTLEEVSGDNEYGSTYHRLGEMPSNSETSKLQELSKSQCDGIHTTAQKGEKKCEELSPLSMSPGQEDELKIPMGQTHSSVDSKYADFKTCEKSLDVLDLAVECAGKPALEVHKKNSPAMRYEDASAEKPVKNITEKKAKEGGIVKNQELSTYVKQENSCSAIRNSARKKGMTNFVCGKKKGGENKIECHLFSERTGHAPPKRKIESRPVLCQSKSNNSARRGGRGSFPRPVEESLPGESQPELVSWMSMCSLENGNPPPSNASQEKDMVCTQSSVTPENEDSPYSEILTILRVLEENEDESSLERILAKRGSPSKGLSARTHEEETSDLSSSHKLTLVSDHTEDNCKLPEVEDVSPVSSIIPSDSAMSENSTVQCSVLISDSCQEDNTAKPDMVNSLSGLSHHSHVQEELRDLLTFLDAVDQSCSSMLHPSPQSTVTGKQPPSSSGSPDKMEQLLLMGQSDLAQEVLSLRLSLEEKDATIKLLRSALCEQKENQGKREIVHSKELEDRTRQIKVECEAVVKRHQKFIDQLIDDKKSLSERCESLIQESQQTEEKHRKSLSTLEEKHKVELQRMKDITAATEKLKRERWVETKTKKIKELTVRGLEPELTRLTTQHEQEMSALRTLHAQEIEQIELRAVRRASQQMETLREQLLQEKEDALSREREVLRQRIEKQQLLYEEEGAEQRRRLIAEVRREKDRITTIEARMETQFEERKRALEREIELERERLRREFADKIDEIQRKQQLEISQLREVFKAEKETWTENYQQQQRQSLAQTTAEIREQLKRERDREIEIVIERLESEASLSREEKEKAAENRLRRIRDQLTSELRDVECSLNSLKEKYAEARAQAQEREDKLVSIEIYNRSLQTQLLETQKVADQLSTERADIKQVLRGEIEHEMQVLRQQISEQHARHQHDLKVFADQAERERSNYQQELQQLYTRVKLAISKKEEVVKATRAKQKLAEEQSAHFQALLEQRRRDSIMS